MLPVQVQHAIQLPKLSFNISDMYFISLSRFFCQYGCNHGFLSFYRKNAQDCVSNTYQPRLNVKKSKRFKRSRLQWHDVLIFSRHREDVRIMI